MSRHHLQGLGIFLIVSSFLMSLMALIWVYRVAKDTRLLTPIAVLDRNAFIRSIPKEANEADRAKAIRELSELEQKFVAEGYLVVDSQWVLGAPEELLITPEVPDAP